jgi:hypothetical protein
MAAKRREVLMSYWMSIGGAELEAQHGVDISPILHGLDGAATSIGDGAGVVVKSNNLSGRKKFKRVKDSETNNKGR